MCYPHVFLEIWCELLYNFIMLNRTEGEYSGQLEVITLMPIQEPVDTASYPKSAAQWLISLLNLLAGIINRNGDLSPVVITEAEYQQLSAILDDFAYGVGEDENHPLSAVMTLVGMLIKTYEDEHFPKLVDLFPELTKGISVIVTGKSDDSKRDEIE